MRWLAGAQLVQVQFGKLRLATEQVRARGGNIGVEMDEIEVVGEAQECPELILGHDLTKRASATGVCDKLVG